MIEVSDAVSFVIHVTYVKCYSHCLLILSYVTLAPPIQCTGTGLHGPFCQIFSGLSESDFKALKIPDMKQVVEIYCRKMNIPAIDNWAFYVTFVIFRMAAILQGVYKRALSGRNVCF